MAEPGESRWLVLIHQIPPTPAYLRVKIGRRLARMGAVAIKNSVYVLPATDRAQEDFQWLRGEILEGGGGASVCEGRFVDGLSNGEIESLFNVAREVDYCEIADEARRFGASLKRRRKLDDQARAAAGAFLARFEKRLSEVVAIDFFGASGAEAALASLDGVRKRLAALSSRPPAAPERQAPPRVRGQTWVTRKGVHVDRMACAWLIRRFIDPEARFKFVPARGYEPEVGEIRFDMFEAEFTHVGDRCTFETLLERFEIEDAALRPVAEIVHEIDLKDSKFGRTETPGIERVIAGIATGNRDDEARIAHGGTVFEGLYEYFRRKRG